MEHLHDIIMRDNKHYITSENGNINISFDDRLREFRIEVQNGNGVKNYWIGEWRENVEFIQLMYRYQFFGHDNHQSINDFRQAKIKLIPGPHKNQKNITYDNMWIFDRAIFFGSSELIFYSNVSS